MWYRTGTVSVTNGSKVVTGSGTAWAANVQSGDAFHAPDGKTYEIDFVGSDASLNLVDSYAGTTASGQSYKVQPTQGRVRDLAAAVSTLITEYGSIESALTVLSGNVGIGTVPAGKLDVNGAVIFRDAGTQIGSVFKDGAALNLQSSSGAAGGLKVGTSAATPLALYTNGLEAARIDSSGNVGVGTNSPLFKLDVSGLAAVGTKTASPGAGGNIRYRDDTGTARYAVGITGSAAETGWSIYDLVASAERLRLDSTGNLGIGVTPTQKLEAVGVIRASHGTNSAFRGFDFGATATLLSYGGVQMELLNGEMRLTAGYGGYGGFQTFYTNGAERKRIDAAGNTITTLTDVAPTLAAARQLVMNRVSDTQVLISMRGADGTTRSTVLTLS